MTTSTAAGPRRTRHLVLIAACMIATAAGTTVAAASAHPAADPSWSAPGDPHWADSGRSGVPCRVGPGPLGHTTAYFRKPPLKPGVVCDQELPDGSGQYQ